LIQEDEIILPTMVSRKVGDGVWETITFDHLRKGDVFRFLKGSYEKVYIATSDAELEGPEEQCNYKIEADYA
jgi:hypothetical protein